VPVPPRPLEIVRQGGRATALLRHPLRLAILREAVRPRSATEIAARLGQTRQKVHYHVRRLHEAGYLAPAGRRRRRGLVEQRFVASARRYVLAPEVLEALDANPPPPEGPAGFSLGEDVRFSTEAGRAAFLRALQRTVRRLVARHAATPRARGRRAGAGRLVRLVVVCHPVPRERRGGRDDG
jgi:biotin operon repressor